MQEFTRKFQYNSVQPTKLKVNKLSRNKVNNILNIYKTFKLKWYLIKEIKLTTQVFRVMKTFKLQMKGQFKVSLKIHLLPNHHIKVNLLK